MQAANFVDDTGPGNTQRAAGRRPARSRAALNTGARGICARIVLVAGLLTSTTVAALAGGNPVTGKKKALQCQTCHGMDGLSKLPEAPNLAGQVEIYLIKAMGDYKSGARKNDMMSVVAPGLSESDILDLAAYFTALPPQ